MAAATNLQAFVAAYISVYANIMGISALGGTVWTKKVEKIHKHK